MTIKVIGAGFGRTGTLSMKAALEHLGLGPCYHMLEVVGRPDKADAWYAAAQGGPAQWGTTDWGGLLAGYQSCVDWPASYFWQPLSDHYPDAKVILTVRDEAAWWNSINNTILHNMRRSDPITDPDRLRMRRMSRDLIVGRVFGGILDDRAHALAVYRQNIKDVTETLPKDRLLVFDVAQGWPPLCAFLNLPIPDTPFPRTNSTSEFQERAAANRANTVLSR
ncbi:MAG: sulfotransferase family protein [Proteobacteria bacterium]|nr:sulfotransferase family protein [Pseudomonadota bacterium]